MMVGIFKQDVGGAVCWWFWWLGGLLSGANLGIVAAMKG